MLWQRIPGHAASTSASVQGMAHDGQGRALPGVKITALRSGAAVRTVLTNGEGIFRLLDLPLGSYQLRAEREGLVSLEFPAGQLTGGQLLSLELRLQPIATPAMQETMRSGLPGVTGPPVAESPLASNYPNALQNLRPPSPWPMAEVPGEIPPMTANFSASPDRWNWDALPAWDRYGRPGEFPYTKSHWYDPFDRNVIKGDKPIFGQSWFFNFTGTSLTQLDVRRLPVPSGISAEQPNSEGFFGKGEQFFASQSFRFSFDLFQGDASFRPIDLRFRFTPEVNLNFLQTRERGLVNIDVRDGINRFDTHTGIQEAFVEAKIHDLSPNFDFVSIRAGIQQFVSDFRGFLFSEEQPGIRIFGNLRSNRINYNLAYFLLPGERYQQRAEYLQPTSSASLYRQCLYSGLSDQGLYHGVQLPL